MLTSLLKAFIEEHETEDVHTIALRAKGNQGIDIQLAIRQIKGKQIAKNKVPSWYANDDIIYPAHLSLEQSSSEYTAIFKSKWIKGDSLVDLTGGQGVDFYFLARNFVKATYIEQKEELVEIAKHNFAVLGLNNIETIHAQAEVYLANMVAVDTIYIDPARRDDAGRKIVVIEDCTPNVIEIEDMLEQKANQVYIKLSPMLDIALAIQSLRNITKVYVISYANECKELVLKKTSEKLSDNTRLVCVNIDKQKEDIFTFDIDEEKRLSIKYADDVGKYIYEPNASLLKAGAYKSVAQQFGISKLHPNSHLYTSDSLINNFHGRAFEIKDICTFSKKEIKDKLGNITKANLSVRNFPASVNDLKKRLNISDGGDAYLFATTLSDERKVILICQKAN